MSNKKSLAHISKECESVISYEHSQEFSKEFIAVNWCLLNACNFKCSYCPAVLHYGHNAGPKIADAKRFVDKVFEHYKKTPYFEFTGGEPTFYKYFDELINYIAEKGGAIGLISNGSRPLKWWQERIDKIDHVCVTFHNQFADADQFAEVVKLLAPRITTHVNVMMDPDCFDACHEFAKKMRKEISKLSIAIQAIQENIVGQVISYTDDQIEIIQKQDIPYFHDAPFEALDGKDMKAYRGFMKQVNADGISEELHPSKIIAKRQNNWEGWLCYAGVENLVVNLNRNIQRGWCQVGGILGNLQDQDWQLPIEPIVCNKDFCHCGFDMMSTKILNRNIT